jgi:predicted PurR-regulated permease PerM
VVVALAFILIGVGDWLVNRWLENRSVKMGSFAIVLAVFGGLELYGLMGALLFAMGAVLVVAVLSEIGPEEVVEILVAADSPSPPE